MGTDQQSTPLSAEQIVRRARRRIADLPRRVIAEGPDYGYVVWTDALDIMQDALDAARERPSVLDAVWQHPDNGHDHWYTCIRCGVDNGINDRLTEPDAGEGTEPPSPDGEPIDPPFLIAVPAPDTTEATLRAALETALAVAIHEYEDPECSGDPPYSAEVEKAHALIEAMFRTPLVRAALQQPAVQPEGGPE